MCEGSGGVSSACDLCGSSNLPLADAFNSELLAQMQLSLRSSRWAIAPPGPRSSYSSCHRRSCSRSLCSVWMDNSSRYHSRHVCSDSSVFMWRSFVSLRTLKYSLLLRTSVITPLWLFILGIYIVSRSFGESHGFFKLAVSVKFSWRCTKLECNVNAIEALLVRLPQVSASSLAENFRKKSFSE